jgi:alpha-L-fucosidase
VCVITECVWFALDESASASSSPRQSAYDRLQEIVTDTTRLSSKTLQVVLSYVILYAETIGVIVHWGVYSVPAFDSVSSARQRRIQNGSEWYAKRLTVAANTYRPTSGWKETQEYHRKTFGVNFPYKDFAKRFTAVNFNIDSWMLAFRRAGASYAIITAKHHDGFCLWPSRTTNFTSASAASATNGHRDIIQEFKDGCDRWGLKFGVYYSWMEFDRTCTKEYLDSVVVPQIRELVRYKPRIFWFDGDWPCTTNYARGVIDQCVEYVKRAIPDVSINDRIGHMDERRTNPAFLGKSTYRVYEDRAIPNSKPVVEWEHVNTIGLSWGYNRQQTDSDYKPASELFEIYQSVLGQKNGRLLLNVGPDETGSLCAPESTRLLEFGRLLP